MERNAIPRNPYQVPVLFDLDTIGIIGARGPQRCEMQYNQPQNGQRHRNHMQGKEPVQGRIGDDVIAANPGRKVFTDHRYRAKQGNNDLSPPIGHLTPWQQIPHESLRHQEDEDDHTEEPQQFARLFE